MFKWFAILGIVTALGGGFLWYTNFVHDHATQIQKAVDQKAVMQRALDDQAAEIEQYKSHAKEQQRQIYLRDKVYHDLKAESVTLQSELSELSSEQHKMCDALVMDSAVIERVRRQFSSSPSPIATEDSVRETVPGSSSVPADYSTAFPGDDP